MIYQCSLSINTLWLKKKNMSGCLKGAVDFWHTSGMLVGRSKDCIEVSNSPSTKEDPVDTSCS